jgi:LmbE family N-acetylglucosaminyl deacetylase
LLAAPLQLGAQERGAAALGELIQHLGVNARVLMIGAHPDDEDTNLITWLQRGRGVETAYLSLTRGDGGQNLIGNELGELLGVIRTEELLAARRIDGARQYFTRAFDFGFSKDTIDTYKQWQRDSILGDVVRIVRAFRPHVIVAVFSGTPRDGHGHHQVSGLMARAAYDVAGDTIRFPLRAYGSPWTVPKFYRAARGNAQNGTLGVDVGEYSPLLGRSYAEIAGESRSQHKSQGFGASQQKGPVLNYVRREASRVNEATAANAERSMFDGIDTTWSRVGSNLAAERALLDSLPVAFANVKARFDAFAPHLLIAPLVRVRRLLLDVCRRNTNCNLLPDVRNPDFNASVLTAIERVAKAEMLARGIEVEATATEEWPAGQAVAVTATVFNRGVDTVRVSQHFLPVLTIADEDWSPTGIVPPGGVLRVAMMGVERTPTSPWWLRRERSGAMFREVGTARAEDRLGTAGVGFMIFGSSNAPPLPVSAPVTFREVDDIRGEVRRPIAVLPAILLTFAQTSQFAPVSGDLTRVLDLRVRSLDSAARVVKVTVYANGLVPDSVRTITLQPRSEQTLTFDLRGRLSRSSRTISAIAESNGDLFLRGYNLIDYDHIRQQRVLRLAESRLNAVDVKVPPSLRVAYVAGVGDNVAPTLSQLGVSTTTVKATDIAKTELTAFTAVVIGPRAYEAHPELLAANAKLFDFARRGGAVIVQYGQYEMTQPGMTPFPVTINRPHDRVTLEDAPITILDPAARELMWPNKITDADFAGWVQERGLYMPRTFDANYRALFAMNDPGENPIRGGVLIAPLGKGKYIYTSLAFFRQLPAGVPGAARLFVNLLSANLPSTAVTP